MDAISEIVKFLFKLALWGLFIGVVLGLILSGWLAHRAALHGALAEVPPACVPMLVL
jgi:hypothetical protein